MHIILCLITILMKVIELIKIDLVFVELLNVKLSYNNNKNNYDNLYGAVMRPYRYKGALQATTMCKP